MTASGYEQDEALRALKDRVRRLELAVARNRPASGISVEDSGGFFGGPGGLTIEDVIALIGAGTSPDSFLLKWGGGVGNVQYHGTLGATETIDLALGNAHVGTLDQDCTLTTTGWTPLKDAQIRLALTQGGAGDFLPTISSVTWVTAAPTATVAGSVIHIVLWGDDGGTTIWGAVLGDDASSADLLALIAKTVGYQAHGSMGTTETFDAATGWHSGTFDANCTFSLTASATDTSSLFLELAAGAGGFTLTLPASVVNAAALEAAQDTTAGTTSFLILLSRDGGTTWYGGWWGGSAGATALDDLTDVTITAPAEDDTLRYVSAEWVNDNRRWEPVTGDVGAGPEYLLDGSEPLMEWKEY